LTRDIPFSWFNKRVAGTAGEILLGVNSDLFVATMGKVLNYSISGMMLDKKSGFNWKLVVVYGSPYEDGKQSFIDELHEVMSSWQGPIVIGGDFNLVRTSHDKSNGVINHRWADAFNDWGSKWTLLEFFFSTSAGELRVISLR
jgi:hypothetical protein